MTGNLNNMKKLLFVLAFTFIGQQAFSQIYIATLLDEDNVPGAPAAGCQELVLVKIDPLGIQSISCIPDGAAYGGLQFLNQELNSIISMGYKLTQILPGGLVAGGTSAYQGFMDVDGELVEGTTWYFAVP